MMDMQKLECRGCGATLVVEPDAETLECRYCGAAHVIQREGDTVSLRRVEASVAAIRDSSQQVATELAIARLTRELREADEQWRNEVGFAQVAMNNSRSARLKWTIWTAILVWLAWVGLHAYLAPAPGTWLRAMGPSLMVVLPIAAAAAVFFMWRLPSDLRARAERLRPRVEALAEELAANRSRV